MKPRRCGRGIPRAAWGAGDRRSGGVRPPARAAGVLHTAFLAAYPDIAISNDPWMTGSRVLLVEHVDVALRILELQDSSHVAIKVGEVRRVVCASLGYLSIRGAPATPEALAGHDSITFTTLTSADGWLFRDGGLDRMVAIQPRLVVSTAEAAIDAAIAGLGVTQSCLTQISAARSAGRLQTVLEAFEPPAWPVSLVYAAQGMLPLKLRAFLDFTAPRLKSVMQQTTAL